MQKVFKKKYAWLVVNLFLLVPSAYGQEASAPYLHRADSLFAAGKYTEAFEAYQLIWHTTQVYTPKMLLRMAYVSEALGKYPEALYYLNLHYRYQAEPKVLQKMVDLAEMHKLSGYLFNDYTYLLALYQQNALLIVGSLIGMALLFFALLVYRWYKGSEVGLYAGVYAVFLVGLLLLFNFFREPERGIVGAEVALLMKGPSAGAAVVQELTAGHRLEVVGKQDIWYKVKWNDQEAFVREKNLLLIPGM